MTRDQVGTEQLPGNGCLRSLTPAAFEQTASQRLTQQRRAEQSPQHVAATAESLP